MVVSWMISGQKGIAAGDPISPYLFLLATEGLSCLLMASDANGSVQGVKVANLAPRVNHLLFADDRLLFFGANHEEATRVSELMQQYCDASGQRINKGKSSIFFSKGISGDTTEAIKGVLQVPIESLSEKYLGLPTEVGHSNNGRFKYLKDRLTAHRASATVWLRGPSCLSLSFFPGGPSLSFFFAGVLHVCFSVGQPK